jgi:hypothetical protein
MPEIARFVLIRTSSAGSRRNSMASRSLTRRRKPSEQLEVICRNRVVATSAMAHRWRAARGPAPRGSS